MRHYLCCALLAALLLALVPAVADAHCQVPCGIYDDQARIERMLEDTETARKAIMQINELAGESDAQSMNQLVRWTTTKEEHCSNVITVVSEYFLTQKVKPVAPDADGYDVYLKSLADHHAVMVASMRVKQSTDPKSADELHEAIDRLAIHYAN